MRSLKGTFPRLYSVVRLIFNSDSYVYKSGWIESLKRGYPSDKKGNPLPWMNFGVVHLLTERLNDKMSLFEFGCGYSTLFYAERVNHVISVEHQKKWADIMNTKLPANASVVLSSKGDYADYINTLDEKFDLIIVDGIDRVNCLKNSIKNLGESGVLLLDDSSRKEYAEAIRFAHQKGFKSIAYRGLKPTGIGIDESMLFYRPDNCLGI